MPAKKRSAPRKKTQRPKAVSNKMLQGRGDYTEADRKLLQKINSKIPEVNLGSIGKTIGGKFGLGGLGESVGKGLSSLFGMGDYTVKTNSLMQVPNASSSAVPLFQKDGKRGIRVVEREYLGDISSGPDLVLGTTAFANQVFRLNPSDPNTFPWLSRIAANFDQWEPNGIVFEFISTSSEFNGTSQALGTVILASEYDPSDPAYVNKIEMENADYSNSTKPSLTAMHGLECDPKERPTAVLYTGLNIPTGEQKFYDLCNFQIATQGMSAVNQTLGELWVSYDISFYKKQISSAGVIIPTWMYRSTTNLGTFAIIGAGNVTPGSDSRITLTDISIPGNNTLNFDPTRNTGKFLVTVTTQTTSGTAPSCPSVIGSVFGATSGCTLSSSRIQRDPTAGAGFMCEAIFTLTGVNAKVSIMPNASSTTAIYTNTTTVVTELRTGVNWLF